MTLNFDFNLKHEFQWISNLRNAPIWNSVSFNNLHSENSNWKITGLFLMANEQNIEQSYVMIMEFQFLQTTLSIWRYIRGIFYQTKKREMAPLGVIHKPKYKKTVILLDTKHNSFFFYWKHKAFEQYLSLPAPKIS